MLAEHQSRFVCYPECVIVLVLFAVFGITDVAAQSVDARNDSDKKIDTHISFPLKSMPEVLAPDEELLRVGVVHRVIDGDSVELFLDGQIVSYELAGADAPEILEDQESVLRGSMEAKGYLEGLVVGERVAVLPDQRRAADVRGRLRGYLYRMPDMLLVNLEMVRVGHAKHARDPMGFNNKAMLWAQDRARSARKGVWSPAPVIENPAPMQLFAASTDSQEPKSHSSGGVRSTDVDEPPQSTQQAEKAPSKVLSQGLDPVVYVTRSGSKYHRKDCQHARATGTAKRRDELDSTYTPCKVCKPDTPLSEE